MCQQHPGAGVGWLEEGEEAAVEVVGIDLDEDVDETRIGDDVEVLLVAPDAAGCFR